MMLAFAVDNNGGISFNNRVCSCDRKLDERLNEIAALGDVVYATSPLKGGNIEVDWKKEDFQNVYFCGYEDPAKVLEWFNPHQERQNSPPLGAGMNASTESKMKATG